VHLHEFSKDFVHLHDQPSFLALQRHSVNAVWTKIRKEIES